MEDILRWDADLFLALNRAGIPALDGLMRLISEVWVWLPLYVFIGYLFFKNLQKPQAILALALCAVGVLLADQGSVHLFKETFKRLRPCQVEELRAQMRFLADYCGKYGFVSSHAANTFSFAVLAGGILKHNLKWISPALLFWALVVSYSRIYIGVHYPLDILGGAIFGMFIGRMLLLIYTKRSATF